MRDIFLIILLSFYGCNSHSQDKVNQVHQISHSISSTPKAKDFIYQWLDSPMSCYNLYRISHLPNMNKNEVLAWLYPLDSTLNTSSKETKKVAYLKKTKDYSSLLLLHYYSLESSDSSVGLDQYVVTVNPSGKFISGLKVFDNFMTDDRDFSNPSSFYDKVENGYCLTKSLRSHFREDTVYVEQYSVYSNSSTMGERTTKEKFWTLVSDKVYVIRKNGYIDLIKIQKKKNDFR